MDRTRARGSLLVRAFVVVFLACAVVTAMAGRSFLDAQASVSEDTVRTETIDIARRLDELAITTLKINSAIREADEPASEVIDDMEDEADGLSGRLGEGALRSDTEASVRAMLLATHDMVDSTDTSDPTYDGLRHLATELQDEAASILEDLPIDGADDIREARRLAVAHLLSISDHLATDEGAPDGTATATLTTLVSALTTAEPLRTEEGDTFEWSAPDAADRAAFDSLSELIDALDRRLAPAGFLETERSGSLVATSGVLTLIAAVAAAITIRRDRRRSAELLHAAGLDELTGLLNRTQLDAAYEAVRATDLHGTGVLFLDLDGFKDINDSLGHHAGDDVLGAIGSRLSALLGTRDRALRYGGDEFVLLLGDVHAAGDVTAVAARAAARVREPITIDGEKVAVDVSIGATFSLDPSAEVGSLIRDADAALYAAKRSGRGRTVWASDSTPESAGEAPTHRAADAPRSLNA